MNFIILKFLAKLLWFLKQFYEARGKGELNFSALGTAIFFKLKRNYVKHGTSRREKWSLQEKIWENHSSLHIKQFFLLVNWKQLQSTNEIMQEKELSIIYDHFQKNSKLMGQLKYQFKSKLKHHSGLHLDWDLCHTTLLQMLETRSPSTTAPHSTFTV